MNDVQNQMPVLQQGTRHYKLDLSQKRVTFLDKRFYFTPDGNFVPSVTTVLEAYPKGAAFFEWLKRAGEDADEIRDEAGKRGSMVHHLSEEYDKGEVVSLLTANGEIGLSMLEWSMFERYVNFRKMTPDLECVEIEQNLVWVLGGYGGTKDRIFRNVKTGKRMLLDIKTSNSIHKHYFLQLAAYKHAHNEMLLEGDPTGKALQEGYIDEVSILWLNAKTRTDKVSDDYVTCQGKGWQMVQRTPSEQMLDWSLFQHTHRLWLTENEDASPREAVYQIEHKYMTPGQQRQLAEASGIDEIAKNGTGPKSKK